MKLLNAETILRTLMRARKKYTNGTLNKDIQSSTVESFWFEFEKSSIIRKKQLIQMAKNGENRPHSKKHPLGTYFNQYTHKSSSSYDPDFTRKIRSIAPHWLIKQADIVNKKKQELIKIAQNKEPRPTRKHPLGIVLSSYTRTSHKSYDPKFTKQIKFLAPYWFVNKSDIANQKKQQLIQLAQNKEPRPITRKHPLGLVLSHYTTQSNKTYDAQFTQKLKKLAPHWFIVSSDIKKQQLIQMAKNGENRPNSRKHPLGRVMKEYISTTSNSYDPIFTKKIKSIAPHWFKK